MVVAGVAQTELVMGHEQQLLELQGALREAMGQAARAVARIGPDPQQLGQELELDEPQPELDSGQEPEPEETPEEDPKSVLRQEQTSRTDAGQHEAGSRSMTRAKIQVSNATSALETAQGSGSRKKKASGRQAQSEQDAMRALIESELALTALTEGSDTLVESEPEPEPEPEPELEQEPEPTSELEPTIDVNQTPAAGWEEMLRQRTSLVQARQQEAAVAEQAAQGSSTLASDISYQVAVSEYTRKIQPN